jgi:hypothetical protein
LPCELVLVDTGHSDQYEPAFPAVKANTDTPDRVPESGNPTLAIVGVGHQFAATRLTRSRSLIRIGLSVPI